MKKIILLVLTSVTIMASDYEKLQERMLDIKDFISLEHLLLHAQMFDRNPNCIANKCLFAACCYLVQHDDKAERLWQEVIEVDPNHEEANANLKKLYYRRAKWFYADAIEQSSPGDHEEKIAALSRGKQYALKALEPKGRMLDQEKIKELSDIFGLQVESEAE